MYLYIFLLLLSSRSASCFLPEKETSVLRNKTISALIDEMLCLLEAENDNLKVEFTIPTHIKGKICAYSNTKRFIKELEKIPNCMCTKRVEVGMEQLQKTCPILKKSFHHDRKCSEEMKTSFQEFKSHLEDFLRWIDQSKECNNTAITAMDVDTDGKCSCPDLRKYQKGPF